MKNYQIFNAYPSFEKLMSLNYDDYDTNVDIALMYMEIEKRYKIITSMLNKLYNEFCVIDVTGSVIDANGNYMIKHNKSYNDFMQELDKISNADANYDPVKITIHRNTFRGEMPNPKDIVLLQEFITFSKDTNIGGDN